MADEQYTFTQARARLEDIVTQVRKKDTSLEASLDLLEEGVRLANSCTELIDSTEWRAVVSEELAEGGEAGEGAAPSEVSAEDAGEVLGEHAQDTAVEIIEVVEIVADAQGEVVEVVDTIAVVEQEADEWLEADDAWNGSSEGTDELPRGQQAGDEPAEA